MPPCLASQLHAEQYCPQYVWGLQVERLRWLCLQQLINGISKKTVLEYAAVADAVTDLQLLDHCMQFIVDTKDRYSMASVISVQGLGMANTLTEIMLGCVDMYDD